MKTKQREFYFSGDGYTELKPSCKKLYDHCMEFAAKHNITPDRVEWGMAWEHDETHIRYFDFFTKESPTGIYQTELQFEVEPDLLWECSEEIGQEDALYKLTFSPVEATLGGALYITEPKLLDEVGNEIPWNYEDSY
jgi:hypothetical protein